MLKPNSKDAQDVNWRLFDLHYANYQSISKAQKVHLTTLMGYLSLVWGWHVVAGGVDVTIQMLGLVLQASGFWAVTPAVVALFSLGLIGSMNAAGPAKEKLETALKRVGIETGVGKVFVLYELDTHKNIFDYFTFLRLHPERKHSDRLWHRFEFRHFLYSGLLAWGIYTTYYARQQPSLSETHALRWYANICLGLQVAFWVRPFWRSICRFLGVRKEIVYY